MKEFIRAKLFRDNLYYCFNSINIELPELKDRGEDILILANILLWRFSNCLGKQIPGFTKDTTKTLQDYPRPGNIREPENIIQRAVVLSDGRWITPENLGIERGESGIQHNNYGSLNNLGFKEAKARLAVHMVTETLSNFQGNVTKTAEALKTSRSVIYNLIDKYHLKAYDLIN